MQIEPEELANRFATAVQSQNDCIRAHNPQKGNQFAIDYANVAHALLNGGDGSIEAFAKLLRHDDLGVRVMAGAFLISSRTVEVVAALEPISRGTGLPALGARMTLERYKRREL